MAYMILLVPTDGDPRLQGIERAACAFHALHDHASARVDPSNDPFTGLLLRNRIQTITVVVCFKHCGFWSMVT